MSNSERAQKWFNIEISNYEKLIETIKNISLEISFISNIEAYKLMGIEYSDMMKMIKNKELITYELDVFTFIPKFQFNDDGTINKLFKEFLEIVHDDVTSESGNNEDKNLIFNILANHLTLVDNEFGGKSYTKLRGYEHIKKFGSKGVKDVAKLLHEKIHNEMEM